MTYPAIKYYKYNIINISSHNYLVPTCSSTGQTGQEPLHCLLSPVHGPLVPLVASRRLLYCPGFSRDGGWPSWRQERRQGAASLPEIQGVQEERRRCTFSFPLLLQLSCECGLEMQGFTFQSLMHLVAPESWFTVFFSPQIHFTDWNFCQFKRPFMWQTGLT